MAVACPGRQGWQILQSPAIRCGVDEEVRFDEDQYFTSLVRLRGHQVDGRCLAVREPWVQLFTGTASRTLLILELLAHEHRHAVL